MNHLDLEHVPIAGEDTFEYEPGSEQESRRFNFGV